MNEVASQIPTKWREVGCELGLSAEELNVIEIERRGIMSRCFSDVFEKWRNKGTPPYTWESIITALRAPLVDQIRLAETLQKQFAL